MDDILIVFADSSHLPLCDVISQTIADAARTGDSGLALRSPEYIASKICQGNGVIALDGDRFAGFCYIQPWEHDLFIAHSGLIVSPEYRGRGIATALKRKAFELTRLSYPRAMVFGLTTSPAVMRINSSLGYRKVAYSEITSDINFWRGCSSCVHFRTLCDNAFSTCRCQAMLCDPSLI